ncbi:MAG: VOC family protein [Alphaproteobacteria bacterium]|nr:VOC family protein [Alphaproteobacteria bacterium]
MLHHVSVGVRDVERAAKFYDAVLAALGYKRVMEFLPYAIGYGDQHPSFWVQLPHNQQPAATGNGVHISFIARSKDAVHRFHAEAIANGGADGGEPGPRPLYSADYYGAFVLDLDGNKLEATLMTTSRAKAKKKMKPKVKRAKKTVRKTAPRAKKRHKAKR